MNQLSNSIRLRAEDLHRLECCGLSQNKIKIVFIFIKPTSLYHQFCVYFSFWILMRAINDLLPFLYQIAHILLIHHSYRQAFRFHHCHLHFDQNTHWLWSIRMVFWTNLHFFACFHKHSSHSPIHLGLNFTVSSQIQILSFLSYEMNPPRKCLHHLHLWHVHLPLRRHRHRYILLLIHFLLNLILLQCNFSQVHLFHLLLLFIAFSLFLSQSTTPWLSCIPLLHLHLSLSLLLILIPLFVLLLLLLDFPLFY